MPLTALEEAVRLAVEGGLWDVLWLEERNRAGTLLTPEASGSAFTLESFAAARDGRRP
jgi:hypothetical protein